MISVSSKFSVTLAAAALLALALTVGTKSATAQAAMQRIHGTVTAVSATSITIHNKKADIDSTFVVTTATKVKVDKQKSTIDKVAVGMRTGIKSADGKTADSISAHTPKP